MTTTPLSTRNRPPRRAAPAAEPVPQLAPGLPVLVRRCGDVQVGWDPDRAVLLRPTDPRSAHTLAALLAAVDGVHTVAELTARAESTGMPGHEVHQVLAELGAAGVLRWRERAGSRTVPPVTVHGRGPLADTVAAGLTALGVPVRAGRGTALGGDLAGAPAGDPSLVVLTDDLVIDPCLVSDLVAGGVAHLHVRLRDGTGLVGPLVLPGRSSCLRCADLHRADADPEWPSLAAQLLGRTGSGSVATVAATSALAVAQVEHLLDGPSAHPQPPTSVGATLELDLGAARLRRREWPAHPRCGCGAHP